MVSTLKKHPEFSSENMLSVQNCITCQNTKKLHSESVSLFIVIYFYINNGNVNTSIYRGADKSLARPGRKQARKHVRDERDFNNIETRAVIRDFILQGKAPNEIHAILTETLAFFLSWSG